MASMGGDEDEWLKLKKKKKKKKKPAEGRGCEEEKDQAWPPQRLLAPSRGDSRQQSGRDFR